MGSQPLPPEEDYQYDESQHNPSVKIHKVSRSRPFFSSSDALFAVSFLVIAVLVYLNYLHPVLLAFGLVPLLKLLKVLTTVRTESMTIIDGMGIQLERITYAGQRRLKFVERSKIKSIIINEAISCADVYPYIAIITHNQNEMTLAFAAIRVKYEVLRNIYNDAMETLPKD